MKNRPLFAKKLTEALDKVYQSPYGVCTYVEKCPKCRDHYRVIIYPAMREYVGGECDGQTVFARFIFDVNKFVKMFDKTPRVFFDSAQSGACPFVIFKGRIVGEPCEVFVMTSPPQDAPPNEREYKVGPKKGQVESVAPGIR